MATSNEISERYRGVLQCGLDGGAMVLGDNLDLLSNCIFFQSEPSLNPDDVPTMSTKDCVLYPGI